MLSFCAGSAGEIIGRYIYVQRVSNLFLAAAATSRLSRRRGRLPVSRTSPPTPQTHLNTPAGFSSARSRNFSGQLERKLRLGKSQGPDTHLYCEWWLSGRGRCQGQAGGGAAARGAGGADVVLAGAGRAARGTVDSELAARSPRGARRLRAPAPLSPAASSI